MLFADGSLLWTAAFGVMSIAFLLSSISRLQLRKRIRQLEQELERFKAARSSQSGIS